MAKKAPIDIAKKQHPSTDKADDHKRPKQGANDSSWHKTAAARVRMYRHGLGDCFLLSFPKSDGKDYKILIDCGVILGTPKGADLIHQVVADLEEATDEEGTPKIDVLVATHEHWDHLSGFADAQAEFDKFDIGEIWMAWTEDPKNDEANDFRDERAKKLKALQLGVQHLRNQLTATGALGADGESGAALDDFRRVSEVLSFFGIDPHDPITDGAVLGAASKSTKLGIVDAMNWCRNHMKADRKFYNPGDVIEPKGVKGLRVYVLGPPTDKKQLFKTLPTKSGHETYGADQERSAVARAFFGRDVGMGDSCSLQTDFDATAPFDPKYRITAEEAIKSDFFRNHFYGAGAGDDEAWRRIDGNSLKGAAEFALQLDSDTNNTSLALAFELPDGRVLLFPGDAQVGNWESWHVDGDGKPRVWKAGNKSVTAKDLLHRTVVYKVGHHGSHNATLQSEGLEMMNDKRLVALVPVDTYIAHDVKKWGQMPFDPLMAALRVHASQRVIVADQPVSKLPKGTFPPEEAVDSEAIVTVASSKTDTVTRPLYVDYFIPID